MLSWDLKLLSYVVWKGFMGKLFYSFGVVVKKNDMVINVVRIFFLVWFNKSLLVDLLLYDEFNFILMRLLR